MKVESSHVLVLIFALIIAQQRWENEPTLFEMKEFDFSVYCPMYYESAIRDKVKENRDFLKNSYLVTIKDTLITNEDGSQEQKLTYCGLARTWDGDCKDAKYICSAPGPAFDVIKDEPIYVVWRNDIKKYDFSLMDLPNPMSSELAACYNETAIGPFGKPHKCFQKQKKKGYEEFTYFDPTDLRDQYDSYDKAEIKLNNVIVSPHIHGLEVRPAFDGNPTSWFGKSGVGVGYLSAEMEYFQDVKTNIQKMIDHVRDEDQKLGFRSKFNIYHNTQHPGPLFYHDHGMSTTGENVYKGLAGMYLIREKDEEKKYELPSRKYQEFILINNQGLKKEKDHKDYHAFQSEVESFKRNATYRFRVLNNDFMKHFEKMKFLYNCDSHALKDFKDCNKPENTLKFTVIGSDSSLRPDPIEQTEFQLGSAERIDILVQFPDIGKDTYFVGLYDLGHTNPGIAYEMKVQGVDNEQQQGHNIPTKINVSWIDLSKMDSTNMKKRMRPLFYFGGHQFQVGRNGIYEKYSINGHIDFYEGGSDRPVIGSTQDWYFINTNSFAPHPIHVHLINFQIQKQYFLRLIDGYVSYYLADFYLKYADFTGKCKEVNSPDFGNFEQLQKKWRDGKALTHEEYMSMVGYLRNHWAAKAHPCFKKLNYEEVFDQNHVSGLDFNDKCVGGGDCNPGREGAGAVPIPGLPPPPPTKPIACSQKGYRYICQDRTSELYESQKTWKEVGMIKEHYAMIIRIRWARTDYVEGSGEAYFSEKERNLIEFPGFVYHCHFLPHEDNEMMRPIMLQPSGLEETANWDEEFIKINEKAKQNLGEGNCKNKVGLRKWKVFKRFKNRVASD